MQPSIPLRFVFDTPEPEQLNAEYLHVLANGANSANGLTIDLSDEPPQTDPARGAPERVAA